MEGLLHINFALIIIIVLLIISHIVLSFKLNKIKDELNDLVNHTIYRWMRDDKRYREDHNQKYPQEDDIYFSDGEED